MSQSQIGDFSNKGKKTAIRLSPIGYWSKGSTVSWYFRTGQSSDKIPYICNHLIID